jgi:hypothetical protein
VLSAVFSAVRAARVSAYPDTKTLASGTVASMLTISVLLLFFDGLSFPIAAALVFLFAGFSGALRTVAAADQSMRAKPRQRPPQVSSDAARHSERSPRGAESGS